MKRILCILLALTMFVSLAACSGKAKKDVKSPADFAGAKIAVQTDTTAADSIDEMIAGGLKTEVFRYEKVIQCFDDLKLGRCDAVYVDSVVAAYYTLGAKEYERVWLSPEDEPLGICLAKGSKNLAAAIEAAVDTLYYNGTMEKIAKKHFGEDLSANLRKVTSKPVIPPISAADLITPGTLSVGAEVGYPPMEYTTEDGLTYIGYDIDVGAAIAELLGLKHVVINTSWDGIFAGLEKGQYDCIISSVSITPARQEKYILTQPYIANALCIVVKK